MPDDRVEEIEALLVQANEAHHKFQQTELSGANDQDWPRWYAGYLVEQGVSALFGHAVTIDQLTRFFIDNYAEFERSKSGESWSAFTARSMQNAL